MSLFTIAWRSIQQRGLASVLTTFSMSLGVMMVVAVLLVHGVVTESFRNNASLGYNMIVGAKGGKLQLVLNTVYYLSEPVENIPYDYYLEFLAKEDIDKLVAQGIHTPEEIDALVARRRAKLKKHEARELAKLSPAEQRAELLRGRYARGSGRGTNLAIPVLLGDYFKQYRIVGTSPKLFNELEYKPEEHRKFTFGRGRNFKVWSNENGFFEAVAGSTVAKEYHLKLGDTLVASHGAAEGEFSDLHENSAFTLVGILKPSGTPNDRAVFVNMEGFYLMEGHAKPVEEEEENPPAAAEAPASGERQLPEIKVSGERQLPETPPTTEKDSDDPETVNTESNATEKDATDSAADPTSDPASEPTGGPADVRNDDGIANGRGGENAARAKFKRMPLPLAEREITAVLFRCDDPYASVAYTNEINEGQAAQAVSPIAEIYRLLEFIVQPVQMLLLVITTMVCIVSGVSILVSIYNSMNERKHEIAVIRALGAGRSTVMAIVLLESIIISVAGGLIGGIAGHALIASCGGIIEERTGVTIGMFDFAPSLPLYDLIRVKEPNFRFAMTVAGACLGALAICAALAMAVEWAMRSRKSKTYEALPRWLKQTFAALPTAGAVLAALALFALLLATVGPSGEFLIVPPLLLLAVLVGFMPAVTAYRTDVAKSLQ